MVPTFILPLVRELVEDALPGKTFTDWVMETAGFSQFDLFLRLTHLMHPELMDWIGALRIRRALADRGQRWRERPMLSQPAHRTN